jgi:hypothetical protein
MSLTLHVNNQTWSNSLKTVIDSYENCIVPVIKGNGYGIGKSNLANKSQDLGLTEIAIGTIFEAKEIIDKGFSQIIVMDPIKDLDKSSFDELKRLHDKTIVLTLSDINDATNLKETPVIIEVLTSMKRFGLRADDLKTLINHQILGLSLHLPIENSITGKINEVRNWLKIYEEILPNAKKSVYLSHLTKEEFKRIKNEFPNFEFKLRLGTKFWLSDLNNFQIKSTVLAVHDVKEEQIGYRQRKINDQYLVIVSGGTSHGVGLQAPRANTNLKSRLTAILSGVLEAFDQHLSPFVISGKQRWFAESPHMNVSMLKLPKNIKPPKVGSEITAHLRMTTTNFDSVIIN